MNKDRIGSFYISLLCVASSLVYLLASKLYYATGFPLDDAWIHQTYARNLALYGGWYYQHGILSSGSTSPLWTILQSFGHLGIIPPFIWTNGLGIICFLILVIIFNRLVSIGLVSKVYWPGILLAFEWHLVWAAISGMETILNTLLIAWIIYLLFSMNKNWIVIGMQIGIGFWVRPDMISLIIPVLICYTEENWKNREFFRGLSKLLISTGILIVLYMLFHFYQYGAVFPNTFYAKQTEYAVLTTQPYFQRFLKQAMLPLVGMGALLVPGLLKICVYSLKGREWRFLAIIIWLLAYIGLYAWRLPVTYQHGRYMIPAMPIFFVLGILGTLHLSSELGFTAIARILRKSWQISMFLTTGIFWLLGARAFALDVAFIQSELVEGAQWISNNTPIDSVIAAHDIGALGYYGNREIVDLAGLINPDVIPIMRNESRLEEYLNKIKITHLYTFPNWYPLLSQVGIEIYRGSGQYSKEIGGEPIVIYRWVTYQP